jgi:hypothetical protein
LQFFLQLGDALTFVGGLLVRIQFTDLAKQMPENEEKPKKWKRQLN